MTNLYSDSEEDSMDRENLLQDVRVFAQEFIRSGDIDPAYPVLKSLYNQMELTEEQRLWFTFLYVAYYNIASALLVFSIHPRPEPLRPFLAALPIQTERRGLRGGKIMRHVADYVSNRDPGLYSTAELGSFRKLAEQVWGCGPWASFKWAEILKTVHRYPFEFQAGDCITGSGPMKGLELLYGPGASLAKSYFDLQRRLGWIPVEQVETALCDFHAMYQGKYYIGHDIDSMQHDIETSPLAEKLGRLPEYQVLYKARKASLDNVYVGELHTWAGVDRDRCKVYQKTGQVVYRSCLCHTT